MKKIIKCKQFGINTIKIFALSASLKQKCNLIMNNISIGIQYLCNAANQRNFRESEMTYQNKIRKIWLK